MKDFTLYFTVILSVIFAVIAFIGIRNFFSFKLAYRNFLRRKTSTILIILGSMIGASLISASLIVNDSFSESTKAYVEQKVGNTKAIIYPRTITKNWDTDQVNKIFLNVSRDFDGYLPFYYQRLTLKNPENNIVKNDVVVSSFNPELAYQYDPSLRSKNINFNIPKEDIIISKSVAEQFKVKVGEDISINLVDNLALSLKVNQIVEDNGLIGFNAPLESRFGFSIGSIYISQEFVEWIQNAVQKDNQTKGVFYNSILLTKKDGYDRNELNTTIQQKLTQIDPNLIFEEIKVFYSGVVSGGSSGVNFGQILLLVSSFAIVAGLLLMINLYYMIAQERKSELGVLRVLGYTKYGITKLFVFEGFLYSFLSSLIGTFVGIGIARIFITIITKLINQFFQEFDLKTNISLYVSIQSILFAFAGAWIITFLTTILSSIKIANLNIVEAIRNLKIIKEPKLTLGKGSFVMLILLGASVLFYKGLTSKDYSNDTKAYTLYFSFIVLTALISYILKFYLSKRIVFTVSSIIVLALNLLINKFGVFNDAWQNGPYLFFINAIAIIISVSVLVVYNLDIFANALGFVLSKFTRLRMISRVGFKYPLENQFRSGLTVIVFGLVVFIVSLISILRLQVNSVINTVKTEFDIIVFDQFSREDLTEYINENTKQIPGFKDWYVTNSGFIRLSDYKYKDLKNYGSDTQPYFDVKPEDSYIDSLSTVDLKFLNDVQIKSDKSIDEIKELFLNSNQYILLGKTYAKESTTLNVRPDIKVNDKVKIKFQGDIEIERTVLGIVETNTVENEAVFESRISSTGNNGIFISPYDYDKLYNEKEIYLSSIYAFKIDPNTSKTEAGEVVKELFRNKNVSNVLVVDETIKSGTMFLNQLIILVQGFLALGLIIGMAGIAVVLIRSVNERRQQVGMLKAIGFMPSTIVTLFLAESLLITTLGILTGLSAGIFSSYNFYVFGLAGKTDIAYSIPWMELSIIFAIIIIFSLLFSYFPARKAGKMNPIEATRYVE